jgi:hypothetical protein
MNLFMTINSNNRFTFLMILWVTLFIVNVVSAQNEFLNPTNAIPPKGSGLSLPKTKTPSVFSPNSTPKLNSSSSIESNKIQFLQKNRFINAADVQKEKLNNQKTEFNPDFIDKNIDLGSFRTKSESVRICYRDFDEIDGDVVSIYTDDMMLVPYGLLDMDCQYMTLGLLIGTNKIYFEALSTGQAPPNTGELKVFDDTGILLTDNNWGLDRGFRAVVTIIREK